MLELIIYLGVVYLVAILVVVAGLTIGRPYLTRMLTARYYRIVEREQEGGATVTQDKHGVTVRYDRKWPL